MKIIENLIIQLINSHFKTSLKIEHSIFSENKIFFGTKCFTTIVENRNGTLWCHSRATDYSFKDKISELNKYLTQKLNSLNLFNLIDKIHLSFSRHVISKYHSVEKINVISIETYLTNYPVFLPLGIASVVNYVQDFFPGLAFWPILPYNSVESIIEKLNPSEKYIFLFSNFLDNIDFQYNLTKLVKKKLPNSVTIHGGAMVPRNYQEYTLFHKKYPQIDFLISGEGEIPLKELLFEIITNNDFNKFELYKSEFEFNSKIKKTNIQNINRSPYLTNLFDLLFDYYSNYHFPIETNRGCPYKCSYCDWSVGSIGAKVRHYPESKVSKEIEKIIQLGAKDIYIVDANFGLFEQDLIFAKEFVKSAQGEPLSIKFSLAKRNRIENIKEIIELLSANNISLEFPISIQTIYQPTLGVIGRKNLNADFYSQLIKVFKQNGLPLIAELILGLPEATLDSIIRDLAWCFDHGLQPFCQPLMVLTNTEMNSEEYRLQFDLQTENNGKIISTKTLTRAEIIAIEELIIFYKLLIDSSYFETFFKYIHRLFKFSIYQFLADILEALQNESLAGFQTINKLFNRDSRNLFFIEENYFQLQRELCAFISKTQQISLSNLELTEITNYQMTIVNYLYKGISTSKQLINFEALEKENKSLEKQNGHFVKKYAKIASYYSFFEAHLYFIFQKATFVVAESKNLEPILNC